MTKQIEGLVARARELIGAKNDKLTEAQRQSNINEAWHLLGQIESTRSGEVDEAGMREILAEECKTAGAWMAAADLRNNHSCDVPHNAALSAMRRVSKTDEVAEGFTAWGGGKNPAPGKFVNYQTIDGDVSSETTASENLRWDHKGLGGDIMAYRVVFPAKTDEGRNAVSDEMVTAAINALVYTGYNDATQISVIKSQARCREYVRAALEAANLCGRNAVIDRQYLADLSEGATINPNSPEGEKRGSEYISGWNAACFRVAGLIRRAPKADSRAAIVEECARVAEHLLGKWGLQSSAQQVAAAIRALTTTGGK